MISKNMKNLGVGLALNALTLVAFGLSATSHAGMEVSTYGEAPYLRFTDTAEDVGPSTLIFGEVVKKELVGIKVSKAEVKAGTSYSIRQKGFLDISLLDRNSTRTLTFSLGKPLVRALTFVQDKVAFGYAQFNGRPAQGLFQILEKTALPVVHSKNQVPEYWKIGDLDTQGLTCRKETFDGNTFYFECDAQSKVLEK